MLAKITQDSVQLKKKDYTPISKRIYKGYSFKRMASL
jgi:hypothetical protein